MLSFPKVTAQCPLCQPPIQYSFELAAERCEDLTPLVYAACLANIRKRRTCSGVKEMEEAWRRLLGELDVLVAENGA